MDDALVSQLALDQRPASHSLVQTENLCIQFGRQVVLKDVSIAIPRGQTVAIIGESGCGKTMFLKSLMGLIPATSGRVLFDGKDIHSLSEQQMTALRSRFGFVFQNAALFDSMNIQQNIAFPLEQHGVPKGRSSSLNSN